MSDLLLMHASRLELLQESDSCHLITPQGKVKNDYQIRYGLAAIPAEPGRQTQAHTASTAGPCSHASSSKPGLWLVQYLIRF